ncbi:hypothetical protein [Caulobacter henricii]|uniref:Secreted protein n=1 Tax=Caulobacter henricii TaxID=69395 RepID=A0A0P0P4A0_9CAUL|nr:hypothetical protein [Caulobacter henricii]ALL15280.1 hypothetical protein AQ619_09510 [Caulobacter henricii]
MKSTIAAAVVALAFAGAANAAGAESRVSDSGFLQAARCRGLAASEGLGRLDTAAIDQLLRTEGHSRTLAAKASASKRITAAQAQGDRAQGGKKDRLLAERQSACAVWLKGGR